MDDVAEKTRRNLLAFSAAILAVAILDIPLDGKLVGAVDLRNVHPGWAWAIALAVLSYLFLRAFFEPKASRVRRKLARKRDLLYYTLLDKELRRACNAGGKWRTRYTRFALYKDDSAPQPGAVYVLAHDDTELLNGKRMRYVKYYWYAQYSEYPNFPRSSAERPLHSNYGVMETCRAYAVALWCWSRIVAVKPSWPMLEFFVPNVLAIAAFGVTAWHVWYGFTQQWPFIFYCLRT
ncbi:hypothetical protein MXL91_20385 [Achromobacter ruhlandii]|uniref:hypothetical protein n=1 Tax=Achromobacter ruhlandii TaxID=72557 RepID=UPI002DB911DB|nr:hypothetical protein [Achromobacter ruhlandii]MEB6663825.1 hypothetical protein [Achromobacter ruhlandii]